MNLYRIYFSRNNTVLPLPVNPDELPEENDNDNAEYNVLGLGPIMVPRTPKLRTLSFSGFFPGRSYSGMTSGLFRPPSVYITFFRSAMVDKAPVLYTPVRMYENGSPFVGGNYGFECLVTSFTVKEKGGETGDFYYDLELTEYKDYSPKTAIVQGDSGSFQPASNTSITDIAIAASIVDAVKISIDPSRSIPRGQVVVGSTGEASGAYYNNHSGSRSVGTWSGQTVTIKRIEDGSLACPYYVKASDGTTGWIPKASFKVSA